MNSDDMQDYISNIENEIILEYKEICKEIELDNGGDGTYYSFGLYCKKLQTLKILAMFGTDEGDIT